MWHERWGEDYDGSGGCLKYTDKVPGPHALPLSSLVKTHLTHQYWTLVGQSRHMVLSPHTVDVVGPISRYRDPSKAQCRRHTLRMPLVMLRTLAACCILTFRPTCQDSLVHDCPCCEQS